MQDACLLVEGLGDWCELNSRELASSSWISIHEVGFQFTNLHKEGRLMVTEKISFSVQDYDRSTTGKG